MERNSTSNKNESLALGKLLQKKNKPWNWERENAF